MAEEEAEVIAGWDCGRVIVFLLLTMRFYLPFLIIVIDLENQRNCLKNQ